MSTLSVNEVARFFRSYGLKYETEIIEEWMNRVSFVHNTDGGSYQISEEYIYQFNDWLRCKGTAYEEGIDNETKINRLQEEIKSLKEQVGKLEREKAILENQLGILPF